MAERKSKAGLAMLMALSYGMLPCNHNSPNPDDKIINPPQSEETKLLYLKKAEEKRERKRKQRKLKCTS